MGLGFGLLEEQHMDGQTGICVNPNMVDFKIPSILDVPAIEPVIVETGDPYGPFGAKGVGSLRTAYLPRPSPMPSIMPSVYGVTRFRSTSDRSLKA